MKILELKSENVMNLKAVDIRPEGNSIVLTGKNQAGKSAVLDSICMALAGKKIEEPIRRGEKRAEVKIDLGRFVVRRIWTEKGERLEITNPDGAVFKSPQSLLDQILGGISFNPIEFAELSKSEAGRRQQRELLMKIAGLDFTTEDGMRSQLYENRTLKNKELKNTQVLLAQLRVPDPGIPETEHDIDGAIARVRTLENQRSEHMERERQKGELDKEIQRSEENINSCRTEIKRLQGVIEKLEGAILELKEKKAGIKGPEAVPASEVEALQNDISRMNKENADIRAAQKYREMAGNLEKVKNEFEALTAAIEKLDHEKKQKIGECAFPVAGLSVDDENVLFDGIPFSQSSTGCQIRVSTAIAMALNPKLRVILLRDASLLDSDGLAEIEKMAAAADYQLWIEKVDESGKVGIYIEDGSVVAVNGEPVAAAAESAGENA